MLCRHYCRYGGEPWQRKWGSWFINGQASHMLFVVGSVRVAFPDRHICWCPVDNGWLFVDTKGWTPQISTNLIPNWSRKLKDLQSKSTSTWSQWWKESSCAFFSDQTQSLLSCCCLVMAETEHAYALLHHYHKFTWHFLGVGGLSMIAFL